jgi:hypothetical protein
MKPGRKVPFEPGLMLPSPHFHMNRDWWALWSRIEFGSRQMCRMEAPFSTSVSLYMVPYIVKVQKQFQFFYFPLEFDRILWVEWMSEYIVKVQKQFQFFYFSQVYYAHCICQCVLLALEIISLLSYIRRSLCSLLLLILQPRESLVEVVRRYTWEVSGTEVGKVIYHKLSTMAW